MRVSSTLLLALPASLALVMVPNLGRPVPSLLRRPAADSAGAEMNLTLVPLPELDLSGWDEPILAVNWADINGDGLPDLFVGAEGGTKAIFENTGNGDFTRFDLPHCGQYMSPPRPSHVHLTDCQKISERLRAELVENTGVFDCPPIFTSDPFAPAASVPCVAEPFKAQGAVWADFNNDGTQDYYQTIDGGHAATLDGATRNAFFLNRGGQLFGGRRGGLFTGTDALQARSRMATVGDFNDDGLLDILLLNDRKKLESSTIIANLLHTVDEDVRDLLSPGSEGGSATSVLFMQKQPVEENVTFYSPMFEDRSEAMGLQPRKWQQACAGTGLEPEITGVTMLNIRRHTGGINRLLVQTRCALHLYRLVGDEFKYGFTQTLEHSLPCPVLVGDFDNFAATIEAVTCANTAGMRSVNLYASIYDMASGLPPQGMVRATTDYGTIVPAASADFDNDGDLDILAVEVLAWRHEASGMVSHSHRPGSVPEGPSLLHMIANHEGELRVAQTFEVNLTSWDLSQQGVTVADYDSDGKMDVLISDRQSLSLWRNDGPERSWACVRPVGEKANADGIGAIVKFAADNLVVRRDVFGPASHWQDYNRAVCAGLGGADNIQFVEVCWPGPELFCEKWYNLKVNRTHKLKQFSGSLDAPVSANASN